MRQSRFLFVHLQLFTNGNDDCQSHCDTLSYTTHVLTTRGKSLSPPKVGVSRKQTINSTAYFCRSNQRHLTRPFSLIRRQKLISRAKQQARLSPSTLSPTAMGKTIAVELPIKPEYEKPSDKEEKANTSESEYSSLDDSDDALGKYIYKENVYE